MFEFMLLRLVCFVPVAGLFGADVVRVAYVLCGGHVLRAHNIGPVTPAQ